MTTTTYKPGHGGWIRQYHEPGGDGPTLVCFPHAGGSAATYHSLSAKLSAGNRVLLVQYPGRQDRLAEQPLEDLRQLADQVVEALTPWLDGPLVLFGHSMGSVLACHRLGLSPWPGPLPLPPREPCPGHEHRHQLPRPYQAHPRDTGPGDGPDPCNLARRRRRGPHVPAHADGRRRPDHSAFDRPDPALRPQPAARPGRRHVEGAVDDQQPRPRGSHRQAPYPPPVCPRRRGLRGTGRAGRLRPRIRGRTPRRPVHRPQPDTHRASAVPGHVAGRRAQQWHGDPHSGGQPALLRPVRQGARAARHLSLCRPLPGLRSRLPRRPPPLPPHQERGGPLAGAQEPPPGPRARRPPLQRGRPRRTRRQALAHGAGRQPDHRHVPPRCPPPAGRPLERFGSPGRHGHRHVRERHVGQQPGHGERPRRRLVRPHRQAQGPPRDRRTATGAGQEAPVRLRRLPRRSP
ncbi:alpha/beta hydrolase [Streptomyces marianii]|uniref:Alpha/beta hydrolase n=1 Tax=Streptomyces marianii TaxID=1817406 RepID=A0A5R9EGI8_9ACTN|nr:alpha/beta hydrolase [Streptomyces marianii]